MRLLLMSPDIKWEDVQGNLSFYSSLLNDIFSKEIDFADIIVLPELFTTGFSVENDITEPANGKSFKWMVETSARYGSAILASVPVSDLNLRYNRAYFVKPDGSFQFYNKRHLFSYGGENKFYTPGDSQVIVDYKNFKIALNVCYDLRFPVWSRNVNLSYDLLINIANWPSTRASVIEPLSKARAIENLSYFAFVNRMGNDKENNYQGEKLLYDFMGKDVTPLKTGTFFSVFDIYLDSLQEFRNKFRAWSDSDKFKIKYDE